MNQRGQATCSRSHSYDETRLLLGRCLLLLSAQRSETLTWTTSFLGAGPVKPLQVTRRPRCQVLEGSMLSAPELSGESKTDLSPRMPLGSWVHVCTCNRTQGSPTSLSLWGSVPALASRLRRTPVPRASPRASLAGQRPLRPAELGCAV